jgi:hypothetical protein
MLILLYLSRADFKVTGKAGLRPSNTDFLMGFILTGQLCLPGILYTILLDYAISSIAYYLGHMTFKKKNMF